MPETLLTLLKLVLLALLYLFFLRVLRAVWAEIKAPLPVAASQPATNTGGSERAPVSSPAGSPPRSPRRTPSRLQVLEPSDARGHHFDLGDELTVGRGQGCQVSLDDSYVSQLHARIFRQDGQVFVEDLGSTNGTFVNRKKVTGRTPLHRGDRLQVGQTVLEAFR